MELIDADATPYLYVDLGAKIAGVAVDPTGYTVQVAVMLGEARPTSGDFKAATWVTNATTVPPTYSARLLIGVGAPSGITLQAGQQYTVYGKILAGAEIVILRSGMIQAY